MGRKKVRREDWRAGKVHEDEIGVSPSRGPDIPSVSIPYGCLVPERLDNLLAAGRTLSCDPATHTFLRLIPQCWVMGQAAGTAAAVAANAGVKVRDVNVKEVQRQLAKQGVYLHQPVVAALAEPPSPQPQR